MHTDVLIRRTKKAARFLFTVIAAHMNRLISMIKSFGRGGKLNDTVDGINAPLVRIGRDDLEIAYSVVVGLPCSWK